MIVIGLFTLQKMYPPFYKKKSEKPIFWASVNHMMFTPVSYWAFKVLVCI